MRNSLFIPVSHSVIAIKLKRGIVTNQQAAFIHFQNSSTNLHNITSWIRAPTYFMPQLIWINAYVLLLLYSTNNFKYSFSSLSITSIANCFTSCTELFKISNPTAVVSTWFFAVRAAKKPVATGFADYSSFL